jgi:hypothetical protein
MLSFFHAFVRYIIWGFEILLLPPLCFAAIAIPLSLIVSIIKQNPFSDPEARVSTLRIVTAQTLIFVLTVSIAVLGFVNTADYHGPNQRALDVETALGVVSVVLSIYWVIRMKGYRWYAASLSLLQLLMLAGANFVAGMSLTGRWL